MMRGNSIMALVAACGCRRSLGTGMSISFVRAMRNIQVIDGAVNSVYDIFAATDEEFSLIFREGQDVAFIDEVYGRSNSEALDTAFKAIWSRRIPKRRADGIGGLRFFDIEEKKVYYPPRRDEEAVNPNGSRLRQSLQR